jgi:carbamoyl-phosphate synthase large subunit
MGVGETFDIAYAKANLGASQVLPREGKVLLSVRNNDKVRVIELGKLLVSKGFSLEATKGTATVLNEAGLECSIVNKLLEGRPNIVDAIKNGEYCYIINTTEGRQAITDSVYIRREALLGKVSYTTTLNAAFATANANDADDRTIVNSVQELHKRVNG